MRERACKPAETSEMPVTKPLLPRQPRADGDKHKPLPHARLPSEVHADVIQATLDAVYALPPP